MLRRLAILALILAPLSFGDTMPSPASSKPLRIGNFAEPNDLDPHLAGGVPEENILMNLVEGLVGKDPKTGQVVPAVALSWDEPVPAQKFVFHLRPGVRWSNGDELSADDFVFAWKRLLSPATGSQYAFYAHALKGAKAFSQGKAGAEAALGFRAKDKLTLEVELEHPTPFFLSVLGHISMAPLHRKTVETHKSLWTRPGNFVGNGAFVLKTWNPNAAVVITKNSQYWDAKNVRLEEASFSPIEDAFTEEKLYRSGQLDITSQVPLELIPKWKGKADFVSQPYLGTYFLVINLRDPHLKNLALREALNLSLDRQALTKRVLNGAFSPATSLVPPGTGSYEIPALWSSQPDLKKAQAKLKVAQRELKQPNLDLMFNSGTLHQRIADAIEFMWKKGLGLKVASDNREWKAYLDALKMGSFRLARRGWVANYNDPVTFFELFESGNPQNVSGYSNPHYDEIVERASRISDPSERTKLFADAEKILRDDVAFIPLYFYRRNYLLSSKVQGWTPNLEDKHPLKYVIRTP